MSKRRRSRTLIGLFALIGFLTLGFVGIGYAMGWIQFENDADRSTMEFDKREAQADTEYAIERTEQFFQETGEAVNEVGESLSSDTDPADGAADEPAP